MTNTKHTPAPWKSINEMIMAKNGDVAVADCFHSMKGRLKVAERKANARLIAAAPELLETLKEFSALEVRGHALIDRLQFSEEGRALAQKITAALSRAEGK